MKYFLDTEFLEGTQKTWFRYTKPTIDLISIGIVCEDGREYYAISKDFNLKEAWNRYDIKTMTNLKGDSDTNKMKVYWLRDNILKPIYNELVLHHTSADWYHKNPHLGEKVNDGRWLEFNYKSLKWLINKYGKTNKQIAEEICHFIDARWIEEGNISKGFMYPGGTTIKKVKTTDVQFYGYFADYDWVVFCWLFGKMIDLPKGFPMYCIDLKQSLDEKAWKTYCNNGTLDSEKDINKRIEFLKTKGTYPKQTNEHNALADAKWNYELYKFLNKL